MARIHGRKGRLYVGLASDTASAEPVTFLNSFSMTSETDQVEVTAFGDTNRVYVSGLPNVTGSFAGFYDTASAQLYTASVDGLSRKFYLYPTTDSTGTYWFGTANFDFGIEVGVADAMSISGNFTAASVVSKVG